MHLTVSAAAASLFLCASSSFSSSSGKVLVYADPLCSSILRLRIEHACKQDGRLLCMITRPANRYPIATPNPVPEASVFLLSCPAPRFRICLGPG